MKNTSFIHIPAVDEGVDPEWQLISNRNITVQDARSYGGGYVVNEIKGDGDTLCLISHGGFRFKHDAFAKATNVAKQRTNP